MKHMADGDAEVKDKMKKIQGELDEKEDEFDYLESLNQALIVKERRTNDELQEARKELIKVSSKNLTILLTTFSFALNCV